jgi:hypothetical protein
MSGQGDQTSAFTGAGYAVSSLAAGRYVAGWVNVTPLVGGGGATTQEVLVTATASGTGALDAVKATTSQASGSRDMPMVAGLVAVPTRAGGTDILFSLSAPATVEARVLNVAGRPVRTLCAARACSAGLNSLVWNAQSDGGLAVPNGTYLVEVRARTAAGGDSRAVTQVSLRR